MKTTAAEFVQQEYDKATLVELEKSPTGITPELWRKTSELGWLGIIIPEAYGGAGRPFTDAAVLFEELGRGPVFGPPAGRYPVSIRLRRSSSEAYLKVCNGALTGVHGVPVEAAVQIVDVLIERPELPHRIAVRRLDFDDVRPQGSHQ